MDLWWECPDCKNKVDFVKEMSRIFEDDGEACFDPSKGVSYHLVACETCGANWPVSIGSIFNG